MKSSQKKEHHLIHKVSIVLHRYICILTDSCHDLGFEAKLIAETSSKIANAAFPITGHVRYFSDVVEHVSTGEEQYGD